MAGRIGDLIFQLAGQKDPRDALVAAMAGGDTPGTPVAVGATPGAVGTVPPAAPGMAPGAPPAPDQTPEIYKSPPQLIQLYSDLMKREDLNKGIDRGIGLIGASLAQDQNKNSILATMSDASSNGNDVGGFVNNLLSMRAANTAAATKAAQRASVPAIAKQLGIDDQTALFLFDSGRLDQVVAEAQKPDNQLIQDPDTGQYHIVDKKTGKLSEGIGNPKKREIELIDNPVTGGKTAVYKDTKEPVGSGDVPGAGNTELQKNYNAAMRGLTPDDPGYMTLQEFADKSKNGGQRYLQVGNGKVFDTEERSSSLTPTIR
jgi:hypothetical protein